MYDGSMRSMWFDSLFTEECKEFGLFPDKPSVFTGVSYPPTGARGDLSRVRPASFDTQWRGNDNEKDGFLAIHPIACKTPLSVAKAMLWAMAREMNVRHGAEQFGLHKEPDATITCSPDTEARLQAILTRIGDPPPGWGEPFPIRKANRGRMVAYTCECSSHGGKGRGRLTVYTSTTRLEATCTDCQKPFLKV